MAYTNREKALDTQYVDFNINIQLYPYTTRKSIQSSQYDWINTEFSHVH